MVLGKMEGGKKKKAIEVLLPLLLLLVFAHVELAEGVSIFFFLKLRDTIFLCGQIGNSRFLVIRPMCFLHSADVESSSSQVCVSSITNIIITTRHSKRCCYCCCCVYMSNLERVPQLSITRD
jgi:hypothetical protein